MDGDRVEWDAKFYVRFNEKDPGTSVLYEEVWLSLTLRRDRLEHGLRCPEVIYLFVRYLRPEEAKRMIQIVRAERS